MQKSTAGEEVFGIICGMDNKFRVGLRIGGSSSEIPLYCSWPFGVVEFQPGKLTFHGPFVGRLALQSEAIVEICARCSFLSRSVRIKYRNGSSVGVIDVYSFKVKNVMASIESWRQANLKHTGPVPTGFALCPFALTSPPRKGRRTPTATSACSRG